MTKEEFINAISQADETTIKLITNVLMLDRMKQIKLEKKKSTGEKIKDYLQKNNISTKELAEKIGITEKKLNKWLSKSDKQMDCLEYYNIVTALGISANTFFD